MIGLDEEKYFQFGARLPPLEKGELLDFLKSNMDVFAWSAYEAPRINPKFICHLLNVNSSVVPRRQPHRSMPR